MSDAPDSWNPEQYTRFRAERSRPGHDLAALVQHRPGMRVLDMGCGNGELTAWLHERLAAQETIGIDRSEKMLAAARQQAVAGLRFERGDIATYRPETPVDLVFSNAALPWLPDQAAQLSRMRTLLTPGGQLAVQVASMDDHPSHTVAFQIAAEEPFASALGDGAWPQSTLAPERYLALLVELGFIEQHVRLQVYPHSLPNTGTLVEWVSGTLLVAYRSRLPVAVFDDFLRIYRDRLLAVVGDVAPYLYAYKRVLIWGRMP